MSHLFQFSKLEPQNKTAFGFRADATGSNFPVLKGMALSLLNLEPKGVREPHWHPNANELNYCQQGKALMTLFSPKGTHDTFILEKGDIAFVPQGVLHHIANIGSEQLKMVICFNHENPEDLDLSESVGAMSPYVLGSTFSLEDSFFQKFQLSPKSVFILQGEPPNEIPTQWMTNRFKFSLEETAPFVKTRGGQVQISNGFLLPQMRGLALYDLILEKHGVREPHWHPNAGEINFLMEGTAKITLVSPGGRVDTFEMQANDASFMPLGYFHHIENTGDAPAKFLVFFNHEFPSDMGLTGCFGAYPNALLAELFKVPESYLTSLPKYQHDLLIVGGG